MRPVWGARFRADHGASRKLAGFQYLSSRSLLQRLQVPAHWPRVDPSGSARGRRPNGKERGFKASGAVSEWPAARLACRAHMK
jgi:hypothetical protein